MRPRHPPIPRIWLMTDPRMGEALWAALERLPRGAGVVVRHYGIEDRDTLIRKVAKVARRRGLILVVAGGRGRAHVHNGRRSWRDGLLTASAHGRREAVSAVRRGADAVFLSPVFATRSHPGGRALGRVKFGLISRGLDAPVIALGGMDARRARSLPRSAYGWAGIDAWL
ncbi:thiamine phosphate synthase [Sphingomonas sp. LB-2]|uniref:thiamine phosphate synthase n=1 Tax=Sphingomonas caeni TaxID=2984949 RepID=UPI00222F62EE|nr:thiamine phosphate synthase [Sphingomonas caeni]MCW3846793.1 thiamine phosphate synthase [Sphingomonas caeni]